MEQAWVKKFRVMTFALIFSGALNISLIGAFVAYMIQGRSASFEVDGALQKTARGESKFSNSVALRAMAKLSFRELVSLLTNKELLEEGYTKRDLALAALAAFRHFNLEKALGATPLQKRIISLDKGELVELYPGLSEEQFEAIVRFAYREKWPLTAKGLLDLLQKLPLPREESLSQAFSMTPEFYALQLLFQKTDTGQETSILIDLAAEGSWELLDRFAKEQTQLLDLSVEKRRRLLLSYLALHSRTAAQLLLKTDFQFSLKRLDDRGICDLLSLLSSDNEETYNFCLALLPSPRSDKVHEAALVKMYEFIKEPVPSPLNIEMAIARFCPNALEKVQRPEIVPVNPSQVASPEKQPRYHVVSEGDSLWKIARHYKVKVDDLVQVNGIEKDRLYPGMTLRIPESLN